jgi:hypothetical protein
MAQEESKMPVSEKTMPVCPSLFPIKIEADGDAEGDEPAHHVSVRTGPLLGRARYWTGPLLGQACYWNRPALGTGPVLCKSSDGSLVVFLW